MGSSDRCHIDTAGSSGSNVERGIGGVRILMLIGGQATAASSASDGGEREGATCTTTAIMH